MRAAARAAGCLTMICAPTWRRFAADPCFSSTTRWAALSVRWRSDAVPVLKRGELRALVMAALADARV